MRKEEEKEKEEKKDVRTKRRNKKLEMGDSCVLLMLIMMEMIVEVTDFRKEPVKLRKN